VEPALLEEIQNGPTIDGYKELARQIDWVQRLNGMKDDLTISALTHIVDRMKKGGVKCR